MFLLYCLILKEIFASIRKKKGGRREGGFGGRTHQYKFDKKRDCYKLSDKNNI